MTLRTWDTFFPDVLPEVIGCPEPTVERALVATWRDLCAFTKVWRQDLDAITMIAGNDTYDMLPPYGAEVMQVESATLNGVDIRVVNAEGTSLRSRVAGTGSSRVQVIDTTQLRVQPTPATGGGLLVLAAVLVPTDNATGVDSTLADAHKMMAADGTLARLLLLNKAEWANPALAAVKQAQYNAARGRLQWRVAKARSTQSPRTRAQFF
jgi:hypothetical protein